MKVIGTAVTAAHLAVYFITVEARPAVTTLLHAQPGLAKWIIFTNVRNGLLAACACSTALLAQLTRPRSLVKLPPFMEAEHSVLLSHDHWSLS
jgi:hypothetical protein